MTRAAPAALAACAALAALGLAACDRQTGIHPDECPGSCAAGVVLWSAAAVGSTSAEVDAVGAGRFGDVAIAGTTRGDLAIAPTQVPVGGDQAIAFTDHLAMADGRAEVFPPASDVQDIAILSSGGGLSSVGGVAPDLTGGELVVTTGPTSDNHEGVSLFVRSFDGKLVTPEPADRATLFAAAPGSSVVVRVAVDHVGRAIVAVSGVDLQRGETRYAGAHALIVRLGQGLVPEVLADWRGATIRALVIGTGDNLGVAGDHVGLPRDELAGVPVPGAADCAVTCGLTAVLRPTGELVQFASIVADGGVTLDAVSFDIGTPPPPEDVAVVALGAASGTWADPRFATAVGPAIFVSVKDGEVTAAGPLVGAGGAVASRAIVRGPRGLYLGLSFRGTFMIQGTSITSTAADPRFDTAIVAMGPELPRWSRLFSGDGTIALRALAVVAPVVVAAGAYDGLFPRGELDAGELPEAPLDPVTPLTHSSGFVLALGP